MKKQDAPLAVLRSRGSIDDARRRQPPTGKRDAIVLAERGCGAVLLPSFQEFLVDGPKPTRAVWFRKERILPPTYWKAMLIGKESMAKPERLRSQQRRT